MEGIDSASHRQESRKNEHLKARKSAKKQKSNKKGNASKRVITKREPKVTKSASQRYWDDLKVDIARELEKHSILLAVVLVVSLMLSTLYFAVESTDPFKDLPPITDVIRFKFTQNGKDLGAVEFGLFGSTCPLTTKNFIMLSTHEKGFGYKGSRIHMILPMHAIMGGDITEGDGSGGKSALGQPFEKENLSVRHTGPGFLGMLSLENNRKSNKTSIFYVTTHEVPSYDKVNVAFGYVMDGMDVINKIQQSKVADDMSPKENITITKATHMLYN